jgi:Ca-activated chloride channel family protein
MAKFIRYQKYVPEPASEMSMEDLLNALSDYLLQSGFQQQYSDFYDLKDAEQTLEDLRQAIADALLNSDMLDQQMREQIENMSGEQLEQLVEQLIQRMEQENYINVDQPHDPARASTAGGQVSDAQSQARFEITDKSLDFLGFKALRDLLGSLGKSSFGRHDTRDTATGIEASGATKTYEFGDTMNLDITATLSNAIQREGLPLNIEYNDLQVHQCEYQSSCATVLMLDCSHSMILYGEDRFTPAKKVAMALSHLIRTQYPGDSLSLVLFHDSAEELPLSQLARVKVGPYYTNTREGLRLAQRILQRQRKDMKQIVMITDGKPSALTLEDGRIYKNAFGLDPLVVSETLKEVSKCKRAGVLINTFMLASDYGLVQFVQKVTEMCRGKAYFTTPYTLGQYLLMDYMSRKTKTVH